MRTYWLSFCDGTRPEGQQFLGVAIVDVTDAQAAAALEFLDLTFPAHADDGGWIAAACMIAHEMGCNPGGEIAAAAFPDPVPAALAALPRGQLLQRVELAALGVV
jgi:hypothetical protein